MCKINPRIDFAFKKLFGSEGNKDLLISLINSIISKDEQITSVHLKNPYNLADYRIGKMSILDIKAEDENGKLYNIEMQIGQDLNFDKRSIYYWSKMVSEQLSENMMFKQLNKTISINILDFNFIENNPNFHNKYRILNEKTGIDDNLHNMFELHYIELKKFKKQYSEISSQLDRWISFLIKANQLDKHNLPNQLADDTKIIKAIDEVDRMFNEEERDIYNIRLQSQMDFESKLDSAREVGMQTGIKEGIEKGLKEGVEKGLKEGVEKGEKEKAVNIAIASIKKGIDITTISEITGLSIHEIKEIKNKL